MSMAQALYQMEIQLRLDHFGLSDRTVQRFGVREVESRIDVELGGHTFYVNGVKVTHSVPNSRRETCWKLAGKAQNASKIQWQRCKHLKM